jgi:hypothetical protein
MSEVLLRLFGENGKSQVAPRLITCCSGNVDVRVIVVLEWDAALNTLFTIHMFLP